jgi:hypothetical protein
MYFRHFSRVDYDIYGDGTTVNMPSLTSFAAIRAKQLLDNVAFYSYYNVSDGERPDNVSQTLYGTPKYYWTFFIINDHLVNYYDDWPKGTNCLKCWINDRYSNLAAITSAQGGTDDIIYGKFNLGEIVVGQISGATGYLVAKYPTDGYIEIEPISGTFREQEGIQGIDSQDFISTEAIVPKAQAPHHHIDISTGEITIRRTAGTRAVSFYEWEQENDIERARIRVIKPEYIRRVVDDFVREIGS